jgi:AcrR family transcriptional regulator
MTYAAPEPRRRRGRKPLISRERIVEAAFELGIEHLTMAAVAERLGVSHQSLYNWVRDRDELIDLVSDQLVAGIRLPDEPDLEAWRDSLRVLANGLHRIADAAPGFAAAGLGRYRTSPAYLDLNESTLRLLVDAGFEPAMAQRTYETVITVLLGWLAREDTNAPLRAHPDRARIALEVSAASSGGRHERSSAAALAELAAPTDERFEFLVHTVLAGLPDPATKTAVELGNTLLDIREPATVGAPIGDV